MMKETLVLLNDPVYSWEVDKAWIWQDDAACGFSPPSMFEIALMGDPITEGLTPKEVWDLNNTNFLAAEKICAKCPVFVQCYTEAEEFDFRTTMRAGVSPSNFPIRRPGRPKGAKNKRRKNDPTKPCKNNHELRHWKERYDKAGWECSQCIRERNGHKELQPLSPTCPKGHEDWSYRKNGRRYCKTCNREANQARYWAKKSERDAKLEG